MNQFSRLYYYPGALPANGKNQLMHYDFVSDTSVDLEEYEPGKWRSLQQDEERRPLFEFTIDEVESQPSNLQEYTNGIPPFCVVLGD